MQFIELMTPKGKQALLRVGVVPIALTGYTDRDTRRHCTRIALDGTDALYVAGTPDVIAAAIEAAMPRGNRGPVSVTLSKDGVRRWPEGGAPETGPVIPLGVALASEDCPHVVCPQPERCQDGCAIVASGVTA